MKLFALAAVAAVAVAADPACVDCDAPLIANADWSNGVLAQGNYYAPTKSGNWGLGQSIPGEGTLELRNDPAIGNYVWNSCPTGHVGYCRYYINQLITVQAGVAYDFAIQYAMDGVRGQANTLEMYVETMPGRSRLFNQYTFVGNTNRWVDFTTGLWTPTESGDVLLTLTWRDDPSNAIIKIKSARLTAVECRDAASTKTCGAEPEPTTTSTTSEAEPTTTTTTTTSTTELESTTSTTSSTSTSTSPPRGCKRRRNRIYQ